MKAHQDTEQALLLREGIHPHLFCLVLQELLCVGVLVVNVQALLWLKVVKDLMWQNLKNHSLTHKRSASPAHWALLSSQKSPAEKLLGPRGGFVWPRKGTMGIFPPSMLIQ